MARLSRNARSFSRLSAHALDHRRQAVRTLRRQMVAQAQLFEDLIGVRRQDLAGWSARIKCKEYCNETAHDMRIAVTAEADDRILPVGARRLEPDLADAALDL